MIFEEKLDIKVLMYGWEFPPFISGGLGVACHDLTKALTDLGLKIHFVLPSFGSHKTIKSHVDLINSSKVEVSYKDLSSAVEYFSQNIDIFKVDSLLTPYMTEEGYLEQLAFLQSRIETDSITRSHNLNITGNYGVNLVEEVMRYAYVSGFIAREVKHDLIHCHDWMTILAGIEARRHSARPLIYHVHALETDRSGLNINKRIYDIEKYGLEQADKIIAVSYHTKNQICEKYQINPNKIEVVHNAVSKTKVFVKSKKLARKNNKEKIVLFLGRVTLQKGPDYFLEAAAKVLQKLKDVRFIIAGQGDMVHRLIERAAQLKIGNKVHFTGFLNREEVEALYQSSDVYVMPSVSEPFGITGLEAVLFDVPVIMSKQSGLGEVLKNALKVDFWDTDELANQIIALLKYPALNKQLQALAAQELKEIQWENSARKLTEIYGTIGCGLQSHA